jgi:hypothetical protein
MKRKLWLYPMAILGTFAIIASACNSNGDNKKTSDQKDTVVQTNSSPTIAIESFSVIPDDFSGAGCSYSETKDGDPIFLTDVNGNALMKLDGKTVKFSMLEKENVFAGGDYEVTLDTKTIRNAPDFAEEEGYITIKSKDGRTVKEKIFGSCGA